LTNGTFQLLLTGAIGSSSGIEASTDLAAWTSLGTVTNTTRTERVADPDAAITGSGFTGRSRSKELVMAGEGHAAAGAAYTAALRRLQRPLIHISKPTQRNT
jgi:hypothetical protein